MKNSDKGRPTRRGCNDKDAVSESLRNRIHEYSAIQGWQGPPFPIELIKIFACGKRANNEGEGAFANRVACDLVEQANAQQELARKHEEKSSNNEPKTLSGGDDDFINDDYKKNDDIEVINLLDSPVKISTKRKTDTITAHHSKQSKIVKNDVEHTTAAAYSFMTPTSVTSAAAAAVKTNKETKLSIPSLSAKTTKISLAPRVVDIWMKTKMTGILTIHQCAIVVRIHGWNLLLLLLLLLLLWYPLLPLVAILLICPFCSRTFVPRARKCILSRNTMVVKHLLLLLQTPQKYSGTQKLGLGR
mmetsp:Transcript_17489/g.37813  ORF Transcript_17489/g.37813 Transcript_17489/m.37813 type:complete len:302 (-) Transcript_17489:158-1063(-)